MQLMSAQPNLFTAESEAYLQQQIVTYIGNKRSLLPLIQQAIHVVLDRTGKDRLATLDLFSGSGIVSRLLKRYSSVVHANDLETYSRVINTCYLINKSELNWNEVVQCHAELKKQIQQNWHAGFISKLYSPQADESIKPGERVFYTRRNAEYLDTARSEIEKLPTHLRPIFLAPLLARASVHANTSGVFKGFYKSKDGIGQFGGNGKDALTRIKGQIEIECPILSNFDSSSKVYQTDATTFFANHKESYDLVYIDPPYNQHPYGSNYFMLNLLCDYTEPTSLSDVSGIPTDWNRSNFNKKPKSEESLFSTIESCDSRFVLISYNSEGFVPHDDLLNFISGLGSVKLVQTPYNTFRGSRNLRDRPIHVTEFLYLLEKN